MSKVTDFVAKHPREVVEMDLSEWHLERDGGRFAVAHATGLANGIRPNNVPDTLKGTHTVLVGCGNGHLFLIDGAHRVARAIMDKQETIRAVVLTEDETRACVREGQMERFDRETK